MGIASPRNPGNGPVDDLVFDCACDLFRAYGLELSARSRDEFPTPERLALCGVVGFRGRQLCGALVLASTREPLELTNPTGGGAQRDWICELSNQLMGRVKNRLFRGGTEIALATPAGLSGESFYPIPARLRAPQVLAGGNGIVSAWIDYELAEGFELPVLPVPDGGVVVPEGGMLLF
jgi:hypothetical protein